MTGPILSDLIIDKAPVWLKTGTAWNVMSALAVHLDALISWADDAVHAGRVEWCATHIPGAVSVHGRDRGIRRGFREPVASYAARLKPWWSQRRERGSLFALMDQLAGYCTPSQVTIRCVNLNGAWQMRAPDGTRSYHRATPSNWTWDSRTTAWSRYWVIIYNPAWVSDGTFGDPGFFDDGMTGSSITQDEINTLLAIIAEWNPPHAKCDTLIITHNENDFLSTAAPGFPMPETSWAEWGTYDESGAAIGTRLETCDYCRGMP